jgi:hypothetical protein
LSLGPADLVGAGEPAKISRLVGVLGNEEAYHRRRRRWLLGLCHQRCRSQKSDGNGGKKDRSAHFGFLPWSLFNTNI